MKLSASDKALLNDFYESPVYKVFYEHFLQGEWDQIAKRSLQAMDMLQLKHLQGQANALQQIHQELKKIHKEEGAK